MIKVDLYSKRNEHDMAIVPFVTGEVSFETTQEFRAHLNNQSWIEVQVSGKSAPISIRCEDVRAFQPLD